jgi:uncharacterized protein YcfJ
MIAPAVVDDVRRLTSQATSKGCDMRFSLVLSVAAMSAALVASACVQGGGPYSDRDDVRYAERGDVRSNPCDDNVALGTVLGALGGAGVGAAINRGNDTGAAIGGAIVGGIIGNQVAANSCDDQRYDAYYYERGRYDTVYRGQPSRWRNPNTGAEGEFRVVRTYDDYGYWEDDRWHRADSYSRGDRYSEVTCREYVEIYRGRNGRHYEETHTVCRDGDSWRYAG